MFSQITARKHIKQNFHSVTGIMSQGWDLGVLGVKNFSVGICDGALSTVRSSFVLFCTQLTFDLILRHMDIFRLGIHPYRIPYTCKDIIRHGCQLLLNFAIKSENKPLLFKWTANYFGKLKYSLHQTIKREFALRAVRQFFI